LNYKIKNLLVLLFIVIATLLIISSVNAANTDENNTLMDDSLSLNNVEPIEEQNSDISNDIIAINNDDGNEIEDLDSEIEVSNNHDTLGSVDDSDKLSTASFEIRKTTLTPVVRVGDDVYFEIFVKNNGWDSYNDPNNWWYGVLTINDWFDEDELEYIDFTPNAWPGNYLEPQFSDSYGRHLEFKYLVYSGWPAGSTLNFTVHFKAKKAGYFENGAHIWYNGQDYWGRSKVLVGDPDLNITKTTSTPKVMLGDDVYFDIYVENNGTLPYVDNPIIVNDWFDSNLEYVDYKLMPDKNGNSWDSNYMYVGITEDIYGKRLIAVYNTYDNWEPGSSLHFQVHFKANGLGQLNNSAQVFWKWKDWGPDEVHEWVERWGNSSVIVEDPDSPDKKSGSGTSDDNPDEDTVNGNKKGNSTEENNETDESSNDELIEESENESETEIQEDELETHKESEVQQETLKPVKNATGNPLVVLLLCLIALGFIPSRNKK